jgi:hypothetical protein
MPSDDGELAAMLREANELRRARGVSQLEPRWAVARRDLVRPARLTAVTRRWWRRSPRADPRSV